MKKYFEIDSWSIIEKGFKSDYSRYIESVFSLGNGKFGGRGIFEEYFSGDSLVGNYIAGIYYPDKTSVGRQKKGYPEYCAKVLNAPNWTGVKINLGEEKLDLAEVKLLDFERKLNMKEGVLSKKYGAKLASGHALTVESERIVSIADDEVATIKYKLENEDFEGDLHIILDIDGNIKNSDAHYDESFWNGVAQSAEQGYIHVQTKKTGFEVVEAMRYDVKVNGRKRSLKPNYIEEDKYVGHRLSVKVKPGDKVEIYKYVSILSSLYYDKNLAKEAIKKVEAASEDGYKSIKKAHVEAWAQKWEASDIEIKGDVKAQQGIRFNVFQLHQSYTGEDARLNIGPKGLTGEKYGGATYWHTEAYCLPFYMSSAPKEVSLQLLLYRYNHLDKAIENAEKLGFTNGAALYPMVTINGAECHNEWAIAFEEIHRNGTIAYAIFNYMRYFDDDSYLVEGGLEVLIAISRFWAQRVNYSNLKRKYVILGVTGPNEYENNVNNNWFTNRIAIWCLKFTLECLKSMRVKYSSETKGILDKVDFSRDEMKHWKDIIKNIYFPEFGEQIFLQQDGFLDKEIIKADEVPARERPIHEHWSWDRILRSSLIKQADVLQGLWYFEHLYDKSTIKENYDFYEPLTVHESSISSCIHSIIASSIGKKRQAYKYYLNSARLDLDDYNNDTDEGLHITSMGGTWMVVTYGFAGMRIKENTLSFNPKIPKKWTALNFKLLFRGKNLEVNIQKSTITIKNESDEKLSLLVAGKMHHIEAGKSKKFDYGAA